MKRLIPVLLTLLLASTAKADPPRFHRLDGHAVNLMELSKSSPTGIVMLVSWCDECPSCRRVEGQVAKLAEEYRSQVRVVAVDVNAPDTPASIKKFLAANKSGLDVVIDETMVDSYDVKKTATALLFDASGKLRYYGQFSTKTQECARLALTQLLKGQAVTPDRTPQNGCTFVPRGKRQAPVSSCDIPQK